MVQIRFEYPLPNNGDRYDLSEQELVALLRKAYENGRKQAQDFQNITISNNDKKRKED